MLKTSTNTNNTTQSAMTVEELQQINHDMQSWIDNFRNTPIRPECTLRNHHHRSRPRQFEQALDNARSVIQKNDAITLEDVYSAYNEQYKGRTWNALVWDKRLENYKPVYNPFYDDDDNLDYSNFEDIPFVNAL